MLGHARWRHGVLPTALNIARICQRRRWVDRADIGHVTGRHMRVLGHSSTLLLLHVAAGGFFGRVDLVGIVDTGVITLVGLRCVKASLRQFKLALRQSQERCATLCSTYLNQVLALGLGNEGLKLRCGKSIDQPGFRHDEQ